MESQQLSDIISKRIAPPKAASTSKLNWLGLAMIVLAGAEWLTDTNLLGPKWTAALGVAVIVLRTWFTGGPVAGMKIDTRTLIDALKKADVLNVLLGKANGKP